MVFVLILERHINSVSPTRAFRSVQKEMKFGRLMMLIGGGLDMFDSSMSWDIESSWFSCGAMGCPCVQRDAGLRREAGWRAG